MFAECRLWFWCAKNLTQCLNNLKTLFHIHSASRKGSILLSFYSFFNDFYVILYFYCVWDYSLLLFEFFSSIFCQVHFIIVSFCVLCVCSLYVVYSSYFYFFIFVAIFMRWTCYCYLFLTILLILTKLQCPDFCFINCDYKDVSDIFFITQLINFSHSNYSFTFIFSPFLPLTSPPPFYFLLSLQKRAVLSSISVSHSLSSCSKTSHLLS